MHSQAEFIKPAMLKMREIFLNFVVIHPETKNPNGNICYAINSHTFSTFKNFRDRLINACLDPINKLLPPYMLKQHHEDKKIFDTALWLTFQGCPFICLFKDVDEEIQVQQVLGTLLLKRKPKKLDEIVPSILEILITFQRTKDCISKFVFQNFEMCIRQPMDEFLFMIEFRERKKSYKIDQWILQNKIPTFQKPLTEILANPKQVNWHHVRVHQKPKEEKTDVKEALNYLQKLGEDEENKKNGFCKFGKLIRIRFALGLKEFQFPKFLVLLD